jgi:O-antigen/teichoic acid export membrane protein
MPADYGLLELLDLTLNVIGMLVGLRIGAALIRYYHHFSDPKEKHEVFTTALTFTTALSVFLLVVLQLFSHSISRWVSGTSQNYGYFQIVFICLAIQTIYLVPENHLLAKKKSVTYSVLSIGSLVSNLSLNIFFLVIMKMGVFGILLSMLVTKSLNAIIVLTLTLWKRPYSFSWYKLKKMLIFGIPLVPASLGLFVMHFSDRFFIRIYCGLDYLGLYSLGYKFALILSTMISAPIFRIWNTQRFEIAKSDSAPETVGRLFTYYALVMIAAALGIGLFADEAISLMAPSAYKGASTVVPIIVLGYVLYGMANYLTTGIMITYKTKYAAYIQLSCAAINVLLNILLIRTFGVYGAAMATFLTFLVMAVLTFAISQRLYPISFEYGRVSALFVIPLFLFALATLFDFPLVTSLAYKSALMIAFPVILILGRFFSDDEINEGKKVLKTFLGILNMKKASSA